MICNYSVIDCDYKKKLAYHWIKQSQQEFIIGAVSKKYADYDTMRNWVKIIGKECGFLSEIVEFE